MNSFGNDINEFINLYVHPGDADEAKNELKKLIENAYKAGLNAASGFTPLEKVSTYYSALCFFRYCAGV